MQNKNNLNKNSIDGFLEFAKEANTRSTLAVEDGLKPVHRRILFGMGESKVFSNKTHIKAAKIVGEVLGNYHPHGDASVYDAAVRLSQDFKMRYPLIEFYGNNGSILDPDSYAAARYTSMRLSPLGEMMLADIEKNTVPMVENYSGDRMEPVILPSMIPNVLLNGGMGIGVGVSSSLVPHNLKEVCDGIIAYIKNPRITTEELMQHIQGPDFPTGGIITDSFSLKDTYESGKGTVKLRGKYSIQNVGGRTHIIFSEVPFLTSIENRIIIPIQQMVVEEGYEEIDDIQNSSGKHGVGIRIILAKDANPNVVLQTLFERTGLETTIKINNTVMLSDGSFLTLGLRGLIAQYIKHQHTILTKKYEWELEKATERLNIVEGLIIAVQNIDEVVKVIKSSPSTGAAKVNLIKTFNLNDAQAQAVLDMRLARLTSLEINKLMVEKNDLEKEITELRSLIANPEKRETIITNFLKDLKTKHGDARRTTVSEMSIISKGEHVYVMVDANNNITSVLKDEVATMTRGKKGTAISKIAPVCAIESNTKDTILLLDAAGKLYSSKVQDLIEGRVEVENNIIQMMKPEDKAYMVFITKDGIIKKTPSVNFRKATQVTKVREEDKLIGMYFANDTDYILALGSEGKIINIPVSEIAAIGKLTYGSKGFSTDEIIAATVADNNDLILMITNDGKAKLTKHSDFSVNAKGSTGQVSTEDCIYISNIGTDTLLTLFGDDGKALSINLETLSVKGKTATGAKIFNSKIATVVSL